MLIRLVCQDLLALGARLHGMGVDGDGIVWLTGCQAIDAKMLADLIAAGPAAGLPVVATTSSGPAASELAEYPNVLLVHRVTDPATGRRLAAVAAPRLPPPGSPDPEMPPAVTAEDLAMLGADEFLLAAGRPRRLVPRVLAVRARIAAQSRNARPVPAPERAWESR
jgi:hypothetical protein